MSSRQLLILHITTSVVYLAALQIWFRWQGDTQREAAVAILVFGVMLVIVHVLTMLVLALVHRMRKSTVQADVFARMALFLLPCGLMLSYVNGIVLQL